MQHASSGEVGYYQQRQQLLFDLYRTRLLDLGTYGPPNNGFCSIQTAVAFLFDGVKLTYGQSMIQTQDLKRDLWCADLQSRVVPRGVPK